MIHTMEALLGLPPMNNNDAYARVMAPLFAGAGDQPAFNADYRNRDNGTIYQANAACVRGRKSQPTWISPSPTPPIPACSTPFCGAPRKAMSPCRRRSTRCSPPPGSTAIPTSGRLITTSLVSRQAVMHELHRPKFPLPAAELTRGATLCN